MERRNSSVRQQPSRTRSSNTTGSTGSILRTGPPALVPLLLQSSFILLWLYYWIISPLSQQEWEMVSDTYMHDAQNISRNPCSLFLTRTQNDAQKDPTEIVLIPIDLDRLTYFVVGVLFVRILQVGSSSSSPQRFAFFLLEIIGGTFLLFLWILLAGAAPVHLYHTLLLALYLSILLTWGTEPTNMTSHKFFFLLENDHPQSCYYWTWNTILACVVPFNVLRLLDRGWQIQRWPLPSLLGATLGFLVGIWLWYYHTYERKINSKRKE